MSMPFWQIFMTIHSVKHLCTQDRCEQVVLFIKLILINSSKWIRIIHNIQLFVKHIYMTSTTSWLYLFFHNFSRL